MVYFTVSRIINVSVDRAWEILSDFSNVHRTDPQTRLARQNTEHDRGLHAERTRRNRSYGKVTEMVTLWNEEERQYSVNLLGGRYFVRSLVTTLSASPLGYKKTRLVAEAEVIAKFGILGKILEILLLKGRFTTALDRLFVGIEYFAATGMKVRRKVWGSSQLKVTQPEEWSDW